MKCTLRFPHLPVCKAMYLVQAVVQGGGTQTEPGRLVDWRIGGDRAENPWRPKQLEGKGPEMRELYTERALDTCRAAPSSIQQSTDQLRM